MTSNMASKYAHNPLHKKTPFDGASQEIINILQRSIKNVQKIMDVDECSIKIVEPGESVLFTYSTQQDPGQKPGYIHFHTREELADWIKQQPDIPTPASTDSLLSIPLVEHDLFIGILSVRSSRGLDDHQVRILSICADQVAMTISKMIQASDEQQEMMRTKASFFSMITHELRSPLNSINGYLELAMSGVGGGLNEQQYEFVQRARMGSEHLYALLENLLLISREDNGQMRLNCEIISLEDVVDNAVEEWELSASDQNITIEVAGVPDLPKIYADAVRLRHVLRNLISNALNFTHAGGQITISASRDDAEKSLATAEDEQPPDEKMGILKLQVRDSGVGIAPEYHARIFERFLQAPGEDRERAGGLGLGLAIVKLIVELHGGHVFVESELDQGSTFTCILPCILP